MDARDTLTKNFSNYSGAKKLGVKMPGKKKVTKTKTQKKDKLDLFKEKIMNTTWHPMQAEHSIKQLLCELIDVIKETKK